MLTPIISSGGQHLRFARRLLEHASSHQMGGPVKSEGPQRFSRPWQSGASLACSVSPGSVIVGLMVMISASEAVRAFVLRCVYVPLQPLRLIDLPQASNISWSHAEAVFSSSPSQLVTAKRSRS